MRDEMGGGSAGSNAPTRERPSDAEDYRLAGEGTPVWLASALALLGTALAVAASSVWLEQYRFAAADWPAVQVSRRGPLSAPHSASQQDQPRPAEPTEAPNVQQSAPSPTPAPEPAIAATDPQQPAPEATANEKAEPDARETEQRDASTVNCLPVAVIPFARNSARLTPTGADQNVAILSRWVIRNPDAILSVEGHTDASGPEQYNVLLSYSRAKAVIAWLIGSGVPERQMIARAAGSNYAKDVLDGAGSNRRVVLRVEGVASCR